MTDLKRMQDKVEWCLRQFPSTRANDKILIGTIYNKFYGVNIHTPFKDVLLDDGLPSFESIRRCRQKAQELHSELRADTKTEQMRLDAEQNYIDYAREA